MKSIKNMKTESKTRPARLLALTVTMLACTLVASGAGAAADEGIVRDVGVSKMDKTFAIEANHGLMRDAALAVLAQHRAQDPRVRTFAKRIHDQRTRAHGRLRQLAKETRIRLPDRLDMHQRQQVRKLSSLQGPEFDKQFLQYIAATDHVRFYQFELRNGALRVYAPVRRFAKEQLPILRDDIARAQKLLQNYS